MENKEKVEYLSARIETLEGIIKELLYILEYKEIVVGEEYTRLLNSLGK